MTTTTPSPAPVAVNDIGSTEEILAAVDETIKYFDDGDIVEGTVVKVDRDEVLLDIGYKTEGVILARELSIKHDVDPDEIVSVGDEIEALVLQKEDKEGRLLLSKKRAQYERAWGTIERIKEEDGVVTGSVIEVAPGEAEAVENLLKEQMGGAAELSVPLDVAVGRGRTWREAAH